jgi:hypothetical protein
MRRYVGKEKWLFGKNALKERAVRAVEESSLRDESSHARTSLAARRCIEKTRPEVSNNIPV